MKSTKDLQEVFLIYLSRAQKFDNTQWPYPCDSDYLPKKHKLNTNFLFLSFTEPVPKNANKG